MKKYLNLAALYSVFTEVLNNDFDEKPVKFNPDELNRNHKIIPKNHKKFIIEGIEIYALSEKRAIDKFKKKYEHIKNK